MMVAPNRHKVYLYEEYEAILTEEEFKKKKQQQKPEEHFYHVPISFLVSGITDILYNLLCEKL